MKGAKAMRRIVLLAIGTVMAAALAGCGGGAAPTGQPTEVTLMLDWVPNVNHTGIFVAQSQGYFADEGLAVNIAQPGEVYAEQAVASEAADFGVSFQDQVTIARSDGVPLVSIDRKSTRLNSSHQLISYAVF